MRRTDLDVIKGISIISVVLYHVGILKSGYLGVDAFFVISGFLTVPSIYRKISNSNFSFIDFYRGKIIRLLPLITFASIISLIIGYFIMAPDHLENLAEAVVASNVMSENILSAITVTSYWNVLNDFKPLMHMWYVGILFEFYFIIPFLIKSIFIISEKLKLDRCGAVIKGLSIITILSFGIYIMPFNVMGDKFYMIPSRFWELGLGGIVGLMYSQGWSYKSLVVKNLFFVLLNLLLLCSLINLPFDGLTPNYAVIGSQNPVLSGLPISMTLALVLTVFATSTILLSSKFEIGFRNMNYLCVVGKMSFSIFVWHQVILAFYRYVMSDDITATFVIANLLMSSIISIASYKVIEQRIKNTTKNFIVTIVIALVAIVPALRIYTMSGIMRDVPELEAYKNGGYGDYSTYNDRIFALDKDFGNSTDNSKKKCLIVGVSFARDFANVLLESKYKDSTIVSYCDHWDENLINRIQVSDFVFSFTSKSEIPDYVWSNIKPCAKVIGIGTKNYGSCIGHIFVHRYEDSYFTTKSKPLEGYLALNEAWLHEWGGVNYYVDFMTPAMDNDGEHIRVFTDDQKFITQDGGHLTLAGAKWYAKILPFDAYFKNR